MIPPNEQGKPWRGENPSHLGKEGLIRGNLGKEENLKHPKQFRRTFDVPLDIFAGAGGDRVCVDFAAEINWTGHRSSRRKSLESYNISWPNCLQ
jgi:hypothetical protein